MAPNQAINQYQKTAIETADNLQLVIMCYDAAIKDLEEAKELHRNGQTEVVYDKIRHVQDIVTELLIGLDYERGGVISMNLGRLYNFILRQLIGINTRRDTTPYDQLIHILAELKGAWEQARQNAPFPLSGLNPSNRAWGTSV